MTATYVKSVFNYLPAIKHADGRKEILYGPPISSIKRAKQYARFEIYSRKINS